MRIYVLLALWVAAAAAADELSWCGRLRLQPPPTSSSCTPERVLAATKDAFAMMAENGPLAPLVRCLAGDEQVWPINCAFSREATAQTFLQALRTATMRDGTLRLHNPQIYGGDNTSLLVHVEATLLPR